MKLTLIKPNLGRREHSLYVDEGRMEPLQLGVVASLTPRDVEVVMYDDRMETIPYDEPTDLVGITVETFTARRSYEIAAEYRARGVPVIMGGMQATLAPEETARHADSIYIGDAEYLWSEAVEDARHGRLKPEYRAPVGPAQPDTITRRDIFAGKGYLPISLVQFSRGCRFACTFCAVSAYFNRAHHVRNVREVVREIESQERKLIFFVDDNLLSDLDAAKRLFRELIPLRIKWVSQGTIDMTRDLQLMALMVKSGCLGHVIGFESIDPRSVRSMNKEHNLTDGVVRYKPQVQVLRDHGLQTWAAFTLGHDFDTLDSIKRTLDFALESRFAFAAFNILVPYPNTPLHRRLQAEGRLLYGGKWWLHPDYRFNDAPFAPVAMSAGKLTDACFEARAIFNSFGSIVRRLLHIRLDIHTACRLGLFLRYSPLFRKEVFKKHGMRLGLD